MGAISRGLPKGIWERKWFLLVERNRSGGFLEEKVKVWERMRQKLKEMVERKGLEGAPPSQHLDWESLSQQSLFSHRNAEESRS